MTTSWLLNPILTLEWRSRWRGHRAFLVVLLCAGFLATAAFISYLSLANMYDAGDLAQSSRSLGASLFTSLTVTQLFGWILVAPLLTASTLAGEREQGLLEGVQLSRLKPFQIVWGKLISALLFAVLLSVTMIPIVALCFLLGGVSPAEFLRVLLLQIMTALCGASVGLLFSAYARRGSIALRNTLTVIIAWLILSYGVGIGGFGAADAWWKEILSRLAIMLALLNPLVAFNASQGRMGGVRFHYASDPLSMLLDALLALPPLTLCVLLQLIVTVLSLFFAARALRHPLGEFGETRAKSTAMKAATSLSNTQALSTQEISPESHTPRTVSTQKASWWEVPFFSRLKFENPMMQRETRSKFRMRPPSTFMLVAEILIGLPVLYLYARSLGWALTDADARQGVWVGFGWVSLLVLLIAMPVMGASAFTRERESGTFQSIMLSLLSTRDIIAGKLLAPLLAALVYGVLPFSPLLLLCIRPQSYSWQTRNSGIPEWMIGASPSTILGLLCVVGGAALAALSIGLVVSWKARRTAAAVGTSIGAMFVWLAVLPAVGGMALYAIQPMPDFLNELLGYVAVFCNPLVAIGAVQIHDPNMPPAFVMGLLSLTGSGCIAAAALRFLSGAMEKRALEDKINL